MARCEDWPCCGHEAGGCPNEDGTANCCRCGGRLPERSRSSMCDHCHRTLRRLDYDDPTGQDMDDPADLGY